MFIYERSVLTRSSNVHTSNRWLDLVGGIVLPILCVVLDPIVFKTSTILPGIGAPLLQEYVVFAYAEMLLCMSAFLYWLWSPQTASPFLAGLFGSGALFSFCLGLFLLPFSLLGLLVLLGILGLSPFLSGFVFFRACLRVVKNCLSVLKPTKVALYASVGLLFALALPGSLQISVNAVTTPAIQRVLAGDADARTLRTLRWLSWAANLQPVMQAYQRETDEAKKATLSQSYEEITGMSIEHDLQLLID